MGTFQGPAQSFPGGTSDGYTTPFPIALGTRARDNAGNEYVLCQTAAITTVAPEMCVSIAADWSIAPVTTGGTNKGMCGVVADLTKSGNTSAPVSAIPINTSVWVQIYGRAFVQVGTNASSPSDAANGPTTLSTSAYTQFYLPTSATTPVGVLTVVSDHLITTLSRWTVKGMYVAQDATVGDVSAVTAVSATHIGSRAAVWLNYPEIIYDDVLVS